MNVVPQGLCMLARGSHSGLHTPLLSNPTDSVADLDPVQVHERQLLLQLSAICLERLGVSGSRLRNLLRQDQQLSLSDLRNVFAQRAEEMQREVNRFLGRDSSE